MEKPNTATELPHLEIYIEADGNITFTKWDDWLEALLEKLSPDFENVEVGKNIWGSRLCG